MIEELPKPDFKKVKTLFTPFNYQVIIDSLIEGDSDGRIWVDDLVFPKSALMLSTQGYFLAANPNNVIYRGIYFCNLNQPLTTNQKSQISVSYYFLFLK